MGKHAILELHRPDPWTAAQLALVQRVSLALTWGIALTGLLGSIFPPFRGPSGWPPVSLEGSLAILACTVSLAVARVRDSHRAAAFSRALALIGALAALATLAHRAHSFAKIPVFASWPASSIPVEMAPALAVAFLLLAIALVLIHAKEPPAGYIADTVLLAAGAVVLTLIASSIFGTVGVFGASVPPDVPPLSIAALALLTVAAFTSRAEHGAFNIFLGRGIASRVARALLPFILVLPFFREVGRARLIHVHMLPEHYAAAILSSTGTLISLGLLLWIARQFRRLESEVQDLSLRDELTGLYNLRGFQLLAGQALRLSHRSHIPFSVLFVDVDNLKDINDRLGHAEGSRLLVETADFLQSNFRESDVIARMGGDEFAVAGHFSNAAIELAQQRLEARSPSQDDADAGRPRLSLSMGHVTADARRLESLQHLIDRADAAMYQQKRQKKKLQAV